MRLREARESTPGKRREVEPDQKVAERTQELAATVDSIPGLIGVLSADGQVVEFVNRQLLEFCGRTLEDFRSTDVVHPDDLENSTRAGRRGFENRQSYSVDHRLRRADGAYRWFHAVGQPLRDASGRVIRWHLLLTDIHERKIAEEKLARRTEELATLVDSISGLVSILSANDEVEYINLQLREYCGRTLEDFNIIDVVHPDDLENNARAWRHAVETGQPFSVDHRLRRADGVYRWFHAGGLPLRSADGRIIRWSILLTDIHERKTAEEKLAQQTEELAALVDSIPGRVGVLTVEGEVEFVNRPLREYAGKTLEEFKDWTTNDTVHPDDLANTIAAWRHAVETGQPHTYDHRVRRADGAYRWFHAESMPLRGADGRILRWHILMTDIHERKRTEQDLALQNTRLELLLKLINQITSNLELREMLRAVAASVRELMHADAAGVAFYDEASDKCRIYAVDFPEAKGFVAEEIVVTPGLAIRRAWESSKPVLLNKSDPSELGLETYRLVVAEGLNGHCLIPRMSRGQPVAIPIIACKAGNSFMPQDVEFLSRASGQIAIAIERKIAEEKLREDERELRRITEAIPHGIHVFGADGTLLHVNQTALDCSGLTLEDARRERTTPFGLSTLTM